MADGDRPTRSLRVRAYGVEVDLTIEDGIPPDRVHAVLPPGWTEGGAGEVSGRFSLRATDDGHFAITRDDGPFVPRADFDTAIAILDSQIRMVIAVHAPDRAFIHAGVVAVGEHAIVLPGRSFAGKTTLVEALLRRGATYYSDEFAVLSDDGHVHPYPKPLSIRSRDRATRGIDLAVDTSATALGAATGQDPLPVGLIAALSYRPGAALDIQPLTPAQGALLLLANSLAGQSEPARVLPVVRLAARHADVIHGERGDADQAAEALLARAESTA